MLDGLLDAITAAPDLRQGLCVGHWSLWDATDDPAIVDHCVSQCLRCPVLSRCRDWSPTFSNRRLSGVVAGKVRAWSLSSGPQKATA